MVFSDYSTENNRNKLKLITIVPNHGSADYIVSYNKYIAVHPNMSKLTVAFFVPFQGQLQFLMGRENHFQKISRMIAEFIEAIIWIAML